MSLVNDLLIEIDRSRKETRQGAPSPLEGLAPNHSPNRDRRAGTLPITLFAIAGSLLVTAAISAIPGMDLTSRLGFDPIGTVAAPPSVAARPATLSAAVPALRIDALTIRPTTILGIEIERNARVTRLRVLANQAMPYRIEEAGGDHEIDVVVESVVLDSPVSTLDLVGTPIRRIQTRSSQGGIRFSLSLDSAVHIQSQWVEQANGSALVIDLQDPNTLARFSDEPVSGALPNGRLSTANGRSIRPAVERRETSDRSVRTGTADDTTTTSAGLLEKTAYSDGESVLQISRSARDRSRLDREAVRAGARRNLEAARFARAEGDFELAARFYAEALRDLPGYREAILEWATLRASRDELPQALDMLRNARQDAPSDVGLIMLHARLIAGTGDFAAAIQILDHSGLNSTEAPEVHALVAAYLQKSGEHQGAVDRYETILRRYPSRSSWWMGLGISLEALSRDLEAVDVYRISMQVGGLPAKARRWVSARVEALSDEEG